MFNSIFSSMISIKISQFIPPCLPCHDTPTKLERVSYNLRSSGETEPKFYTLTSKLWHPANLTYRSFAIAQVPLTTLYNRGTSEDFTQLEHGFQPLQPCRYLTGEHISRDVNRMVSSKARVCTMTPELLQPPQSRPSELD